MYKDKDLSAASIITAVTTVSPKKSMVTPQIKEGKANEYESITTITAPSQPLHSTTLQDTASSSTCTLLLSLINVLALPNHTNNNLVGMKLSS